MNKSIDYGPPVVLTQHTRALLTDYYRIGGRGTDSPHIQSKPNSRQQVDKRHSSSHSVTSGLKDDDQTFDSLHGSSSQDLDEATMQMVQDILLDRNVPRREKERISKSILDGNFEIRAVRSPSPKNHHHHSRRSQNHNTDSSVLRKQMKYEEGQLYIYRHSLPKPHFLELQPEALTIPRRTGRMIQEEKLRLLRRGLNTGYHPDSHESRENIFMENSIGSLEGKFEPNNSRTVEAADSLHQNSQTLAHNNTDNTPIILEPNKYYDSNASGNNSPHRIPTAILPEYAKQPMTFMTENNQLASHTSHNSYVSLSKTNNTKNMRKELMAQDKQRKAETQRQNRQRDREVIATLKANQQETVLSIVEQRKQIAHFRTNLKTHLEKVKHPLAGDILRCVTDTQILSILTRYHGFELSPEAILAFVGAALGTTPLDPSAVATDEEINGDYDMHNDNNLHLAEAHRVRHTQRMLRHLLNNEEESTLSRGQSRGKSPHEQLTLTEPELLTFLPSDVIVHDFHAAMSQSNYRAHGQRTPHRLPALRQEKHRQQQMVQPLSPGNPLTHSNRKGLQDEVTGYVPRVLDHMIHSPNAEKKFASGFKVPPSAVPFSSKDLRNDSWQQQRDELILTGKSALSNSKFSTKVDATAESLRMSNRLHGYLQRQGIHVEREHDMDSLSTSQNSQSTVAVEQLPVIPLIASPPPPSDTSNSGSNANHNNHTKLVASNSRGGNNVNYNHDNIDNEGKEKANEEEDDDRDSVSVASAMAAMQEALQAEGRGRYQVIPPSVLTTDELQQIGTGQKRTETVLRNAARQRQKLEKHRQLRLLSPQEQGHSLHHDNNDHSLHSSFSREGGESGHNSVLHGLPSLEELLELERQQQLSSGLGITHPVVQPLYGAVTQPSIHYTSEQIDLEKEAREIATRTAKHMLVKKPLEGTPFERMDSLIIKMGGAPTSDGIHRQPPVALKTRSFKLGGGKGQPQLTGTASRSSFRGGGAVDGQREPAPSPFTSSAQETKILSGGVPAGAGLALWRPRNAVTPKGRYRDGHGERHNRRDAKKSDNELQVYVSAVSA